MAVLCNTWRSFGRVTLMGGHKGVYVFICYQLALASLGTSMEHANEMTAYAVGGVLYGWQQSSKM